jgi:hypothetical protein
MATIQITDKKDKVLASAKHFSYPILGVSQRNNLFKAKDILPFRISFTNITIPGYSSSDVPGIGVQIVGFSNYIL